MQISQISIQYHKELNPKLWDGMKLKPEVREKLLQIVKEFIRFCDIPEFEPEVVYMTGSLCAYNYTSGSDVDVHIKLNFKDFECPEIVEQMFDAKRDVFTDKFDITIYGFPVEVYVQDITDENIAAGEYDLLKDKWLEKPQYAPPDINGREIKQKMASLTRKITKVVSNEVGYKEAKGLMRRIKAWRKAALEEAGEFSSENLVFKALRNNGTIAKLLDYIRTEKSEELSLEGVEEFENKPATLVQMYKVQVSRTIEWCRLRDVMYKKYDIPEAPDKWQRLQTANTSQLSYPAFLQRDDINQSGDGPKLKKVFKRMMLAKRAYETDGGRYEGWMVESEEEFENKPATILQLWKVQKARVLEWCRLRDHVAEKLNLGVTFMSVEGLQNTEYKNMQYPNLFYDGRITPDLESKLRATYRRMMIAKGAYEKEKDRTAHSMSARGSR